MKKFLSTLLIFLLHYTCIQGQNFRSDFLLKKSAYVAAASNRLYKANDHRTVFEINYLLALYKENPHLSVKQASNEIKSLRTAQDKYYHPRPDVSLYQYYEAFLDYEIAAADLAFKGKPEPGDLLRFVKATSSMGKLVYDDFTNVDAASSNAVMTGVFNFDRLFRSKVLESAYDMADDENSNFSNAYNSIFSHTLGHNTDEDFVDCTNP